MGTMFGGFPTIGDDEVVKTTDPTPDDSPADERLEGEEGTEGTQQVEEVDVEKLDLTEPEHLKTFRNSYQKRVSEVNEARDRIQALETENETLRAARQEGVYLDTNVPLEELNAQEVITRLREEEPDYYDTFKDAIIEETFWPTVSERFNSIAERELDPNSPEDRAIGEHMDTAWDALSRSFIGIPGDTTYNLLMTIAKNEDIKNAIIERATGRSVYNPAAPFTGAPGAPPIPGALNGSVSNVSPFPTPGGNGAPPIMTAQQIATTFGLDMSEEGHKNMVAMFQGLQQQAWDASNKTTQLQTRLEAELKKEREERERLKQEHENKSKLSVAEATRQAEVKVKNFAETALQEDIQRGYASRVPKDKPYLLNQLRLATQEELEKNPKYQDARRSANSWFKQAATARTDELKSKYEAKGRAAIAAMAPLRDIAIKAKAVEILPPVRQAVEKKTENPPPRQITGGREASPRENVEKAPSLDMESSKKRILERAKGLFSQ